METKPARLKTYTVRVAVVPSMLDVRLLGATVTYEDRKIKGTSREDAMNRAGIS
jgi:hypothetical protein